MNAQEKMKKNKTRMLEALEKNRGLVLLSCEDIGIARATHYNWVNDDEEYAESVYCILEKTGDLVESQILKKIKDGDTATIIFYAKTKLKNRGYIDRVEHAGVPDQPITFTLALGDKAVNKDDE